MSLYSNSNGQSAALSVPKIGDSSSDTRGFSLEEVTSAMSIRARKS